MTDAKSTSARLRETQRELAAAQAAFAASQADLTAMAELRADAVDQVRRVAAVRDRLQADLTATERQREVARDLNVSLARHARTVEDERDEALADLTATRGRIVDLLYALDAFQIESGANRESSYATGIAAVRKLRTERDELGAEVERLVDLGSKAMRERDEARTEIEELNTTLRIFRNSQSADVIVLRTARDKARAEAKTLRMQLAAVEQFASAYQPGMVVIARQPGPDCALCEQQFRRSEGIQPLPASPGMFQHAHGICPDQDSPRCPAPGPHE